MLLQPTPAAPHPWLTVNLSAEECACHPGPSVDGPLDGAGVQSAGDHGPACRHLAGPTAHTRERWASQEAAFFCRIGYILTKPCSGRVCRMLKCYY